MDIFWNHTLHNYSFPKVTSSEFFFQRGCYFWSTRFVLKAGVISPAREGKNSCLHDIHRLNTNLSSRKQS